MSERAMLGLPPDLEDLVLARLPIAVLYKARPVCKRWYSLLTNPPFLSLRNAIQGTQGASFFPLVFWNEGKATLRISRTGSKLETIGDLEPIFPTSANPVAGEACATWSWLGYDSARRRWQAMKPFVTPVDVKNVITGSNGLLCLRGESSLLVLNPMTGAQREVPLKEHVVQLVVDTERDSFRILCAASRKRTKIFDSQTGLWSKRGRPAPNLALEKHIGAYCDGVLYCVASEERSGRWGVAQYDVEGTRTWSTSLVFFPQLAGEFVLKAKVIQFSGEIFALLQKEISEDDLGPRTKSLALWKLETASSHFRLAGTMPTSSRHHLVNLDDLDFVALNNRMCILNKSTFKAVACLISAGVVTAWQEFPLDSYFSADTPLVERCIVQFAFEPSLMISL
jgi:F-box interacting protein